jgi:hypothetical protein
MVVIVILECMDIPFFPLAKIIEDVAQAAVDVDLTSPARGLLDLARGSAKHR